jgi:mono/diheme cytochrome c family protein
MREAARRSIFVGALAGLAFVNFGASGLAADARSGKQLAFKICAICHVVAEGRSPGDPSAPSFQSIAISQQFREKGLVALLSEKHERMPNLALTQDQVDDLEAYIKSLAE